MWYVYILLCNDGSFYTGITRNVKERFAHHKEGRGGRYTRSHHPVKLLYSEKFKEKGQAFKREAQIKSWPREKKLHLITSRKKPK